MCKIIKKLLCIAIISSILFAGITIWGRGGDKFRRIGEKTGGIVKKGTDRLADEADRLRDKAEAFKEKVEGWTGKKQEPEEKK
ncbi:MAG: hypothetical protein A2077_04540 [Nitrospirae bacterium GWC2_46_6]|nr:MAG: hypothetical protein A2Z82_11875 [Nitrospirae bacterium GWA2_46_11]OGW23407.1 MAG: hypothetical protein A2077_04540 [Nitrospirae bacterium GWC2_46_6]OGW24436.1 MAG: hypothetical protein A2X55_01995 [Nitrospirae bacterium GWB2_47_37]HAK89485.1 hypothetical protein [Nitrospiraceae bacterium]HCL82271.1 hypothetical protein [Nitrospiraceae bacterium]